MRKCEELNALDAFIETLPQDSYLRPLLEESKPFIASDMLSDVMMPRLADLIQSRVELHHEVADGRRKWQEEQWAMERERQEHKKQIRLAQAELENCRTSARILFAK